VSSDVPLLIVLLVGLSSPTVAVAALVITDRHHRRQLEHERQTQLGSERRKAYATLAQRTAEFYDLENQHSIRELREAHAMVEILSESQELVETAASLVRMWRGAWISALNAHKEEAYDPFDTPQFKSQANLVLSLRAAFLARAREELGVEQRKDGKAPSGDSEEKISG
jgi:hypothetical protein